MKKLTSFFQGIMVLVSVPLLSSCGRDAGNMNLDMGRMHMLAERHPISIDKVNETMALSVHDDMQKVSLVDEKRLAYFFQDYHRNGNDSMVTIVLPDAQSMSDISKQIGNIAYHYGVEWENLQVMAYPSSPKKEKKIVVSYERYVAIPTSCPSWDGDVYSTTKNDNTSYFRCATQSNLASMIVNPRDLVRMRKKTLNHAVLYGGGGEGSKNAVVAADGE